MDLTAVDELTPLWREDKCRDLEWIGEEPSAHFWSSIADI
jgi:hypothetical protein